MRVAVNPIVVHIVTGGAFFTGAGLVLLSLPVVGPDRSRGRNGVGRLLAVLGVAMAWVAAAPFPPWAMGIGVATVLVWLFVGSSRGWPRVRSVVRCATIVVWLAGSAVAVGWQLVPTIPSVASRRMDVVGDSVSVGLDGAEPWTAILARTHDVDVRSHAVVGATASSAVKQVEAIAPGPTLVLLEIGGNDLLGRTTPAEFERDLDRLLSRAIGPERVVVLLELPCPPANDVFGRIQRRLAAEHGVVVVPRRILISVLAVDDATSDSIHLTPAGHARMAEAMWRIVGDAFPE